MDVQNLEKNQRNKIIKELCDQGAGFRQLARITGISYGIIQRVVTDQRTVPWSTQRFFLTHKEINVAEFARSLGMNATLLRNYINGFKKPSAECESAILAHIHKLGKEMIAACFWQMCALQQYVDSGQMISFDMAFSLKAI